METKICKTCNKELPLDRFSINRFGHLSVCRECVKTKYRDTHFNRVKSTISENAISNPEFDGQLPGDVWRMMCRAKKWLESRGFIIKLDGEYREVKVKKLKLE